MLPSLGPTGDLTDGQLLERFAGGRGEAAETAFAALIERHGGLVLRACRAILRDEHEAQDAFQATFLTLALKGRSLWVRDSLGPWLHQVACRAAKSARSTAIRRGLRERRAAATTLRREASPPGESDGAGAERAVHEAIGRLREIDRAPIVLCDLEGQTHEQAARSLGCPVGTVKSRLARGRERLRALLIRRGFEVPAASPAVGPPRRAGGESAGAARWSAATASAAARIAAGRPIAGAVSGEVLALIGCISRGLLMDNVKRAALAAMTLAAFAGIGGAAWAVLGEPAGGQGTPSKPAASRPDPGQEPAQPGAPADQAPASADLRGRWEVIYLSGTVGGERQGFPTPNLIVPITEATINLPALTGKATDPIHYLGAFPYVLDPGRKAGTIDINPGPAAGRPLKGIYRLGGDVLTICYADADRGRPGSFAPGEAAEGLLILRRPNPNPPRTPQPRSDAITTARPAPDRAAIDRQAQWVKDLRAIGDGSAGRRDAAIAAMREALAGPDAALQLAALRALAQTGDIKFDRAPFRPLILPLVESSRGELLSPAFYALNSTGRQPGDLALARAAYARDPAALSETIAHLLFLFGDGVIEGESESIVLKQLAAPERGTKREALRGLWGARVGPKLSGRLIELADDPAMHHDAIYFGLSTLQAKDEAVVDRLIATLSDPDWTNNGHRALWGLGHGVPEALQPKVAAALVELHNTRDEARIRTTCADLVRRYGGEAMAAKLEK